MGTSWMPFKWKGDEEPCCSPIKNICCCYLNTFSQCLSVSGQGAEVRWHGSHLCSSGAQRQIHVASACQVYGSVFKELWK